MIDFDFQREREGQVPTFKNLARFCLHYSNWCGCHHSSLWCFWCEADKKVDWKISKFTTAI